jgi:hypothetical protein
VGFLLVFLSFKTIEVHMQDSNLLGKVSRMLPVVTGSLLIVTSIGQAAAARFVAPEYSVAGLCSLLTKMLPIPGGLNVSAPEIDAGSSVGALTLLAGGVFLLTCRFQRNAKTEQAS